MTRRLFCHYATIVFLGIISIFSSLRVSLGEGKKISKSEFEQRVKKAVEKNITATQKHSKTRLTPEKRAEYEARFRKIIRANLEAAGYIIEP